ncbi:CoA ester lyase [Microbacterium lacus]|uniref:CoA ester lyase n=1 Tax=Microbacterium lacus TaxID=415217 RepID=A0ABN2HAS6_9MICO
MSRSLADARSLLFVPGDRPARFVSAAAARPDVVVLDLEDAVDAARKDLARESIARAVHDGLGRDQLFIVRVNGLDTSFADDDREIFGAARASGFAGVMVPKAEDASILENYTTGLGEVVALVETAVGVRHAYALARSRAVTRLALGTIDLALDLGQAAVERTPDADPTMDLVRADLVLDSRAAQCAAPIDGVSVALSDDDALTDSVQRARAIGMTGKLCIHPRQVGLTHDAFIPTDLEISWAWSVVRAGGPTHGAKAVDGKMIDRPVIERARRILAEAGTR